MIPAMQKRGARMLACLTALMLLFDPRPASPLTPAGTVIDHSFSASFGAPSPQRSATSNATRVTVKDLADPLIVPPRSASAPAGRPVAFLHTVTNRGNGPDSFRLSGTVVGMPGGGAGPRLEFFAADGVAALPEDETGAPLLGPVAAGASLDFVLRVTPEAGSEGKVENITVAAVSLSNPLRSASLVDQLLVPSPGEIAAPVKSVAPAGAVPPGTLLSYGIALSNHETAPVTDVLVTDVLDPLLEYQEGSAAFPSGVTGTARYERSTRTLSFEIAELSPGFSGVLTFSARVSPAARGESSIVNSAALSSSQSGTPVTSNSTVTPVLAPGLVIAKSAGSAVAEAGDIVTYTIRVENVGGAPLGDVAVSDTLPGSFQYLKGSSQVDGRGVSDPAVSGGQLIWRLGELPVGGVRLLGYRCVVSADAPAGVHVNRAVAAGSRPEGGSSISQPASAAVKLRPSILGDKAIIMGRLFEDGNRNGVADPGEKGMPGVRVYLEDGSFVFSDAEGQYSFTGVSPGDHVVKVDRSTLLPGYRAIPYNTAFAGVGWSQFVTVPFGGPARGDFAFAGEGEGEGLKGEQGQQGQGPKRQQGQQGPPLSADPLSPHGAQPSLGPLSPLSPLGPFPLGPLSPLSPLGPFPLSPLSPLSPSPHRLQVTPDRVDMPADNQTVVPFTVSLLDRDGARVTGPGTVTVSLARGALLEPDSDPALPGHQIRLEDGTGLFHIRSTRSSGPDRILLDGPNGAAAAVDLFFSTEARDWILVGLGTLTVGGKTVSGHVENLDKDERFDEGLFTEERLALFTRGKILGKYLLTAAYDSDKERRDGVFQTIDPEKYYPVYGDASDIGYEAESRGKLYLKLEAGRSYVLHGDYRTELSENEFSRYDRALYGSKLLLDGEQLTLKAFESATEENLVRDEIPGNGTSGYYFLSSRPVFENSERVRIEVRDRYHSERIISVTDQIRYADYSIDYNAGTILFKEPVPSLDPFLNPVTIVVIYQATGVSGKQQVYGGRLLWKGGNGSYLGGSAVVEEGSVQDNTLYGIDAGISLTDRLTLRGEGALSDSWQRGEGSAWKGELNALLLDSLGLGAYYRKVEADFFNPSMTGNETGTEKYGARLDYRPRTDTLVFAESFVQKDEIGGRREFGNEVGLWKRFTLWQAEGGFKRIEQEWDGADSRSDIVYAGAKGALTRRLDATLRREQLLSSSRVSEYQTKTFLKLDYRLTDATRAFLTEEYQEGDPAVRHATLFGLESRLSERMRLTTGYQLSSGVSGSTRSSSIDLNTRLAERDGFTLDSRTGYQIEQALSQRRGQAILGLNSRFRAAEGLYLNSTLERVQTVQGNSGTRTAFTLAGEYLRRRELKLTGRYEIRSGPEETASLYGAGFGYQATPSLTLLGKATLWDNNADAGDERLFDGYLGASFRPLSGEPLQLLALARYKIEEKESAGGFPESRSLILSAEPTYRLVRNWTAQGKYAGKLYRSSAGGGSFESYSDLILAGLSYDLAERWELSAYLKLLNQYDSGEHGLGAVGSAGYRIYRNVVLNAGYNYARIDDGDLTGESFQGHGPFFGVKVKFDEEMFATSEAKVAPLPLPPAAKAVEPPAPPPPAPAPEPVKPPLVPSVMVSALLAEEPLQLSGSAELLTLLVNGEPVRLPSTAVSVRRKRVDASVDLKGGRLSNRLEFLASVEEPEEVASWLLNIMDGEGKVVQSFRGRGAPQPTIGWSGETAGAPVKAGDIYQYQLQVTYRDGSTFSTARELIGVNRQDTLILTLAGGAFIFDSAELTDEAKLLLSRAAQLLRKHPREKVIVEGHTDWVGTVKYNIGLSRRRCEAAADYLLRAERIPASRVVRRWHGESRPIADNRSSDGRRLNRRVELKGQFPEKVPVAPNDRYRALAFVTVNGTPLPLDPLGRFEAAVPPDNRTLKVEMGDSSGRWLATTIPVPSLELATPLPTLKVGYGSAAGGVTVSPEGVTHCMLSGSAEEGSSLEFDGRPLPLGDGGRFALDLPVAPGEQVFGMVLRNGAGCSKLMNFKVRSAAGEPQPQRSTP